MANINVKKRIEKIARELDAVGKQIVLYSGIDPKQAMAIDTELTHICETSAALTSKAREAMGDKSAKTLLTRVRRALGFTNP